MGFIYFTLSEYENAENNEYLKSLQNLLEPLGATASIKDTNDIKSLQINYDTETVKKKQTRNAGRKPTYLENVYKITDIEQRIAASNAETVAKELGISRASLFRKLKQAKDINETEIY